MDQLPDRLVQHHPAGNGDYQAAANPQRRQRDSEETEDGRPGNQRHRKDAKGRDSDALGDDFPLGVGQGKRAVQEDEREPVRVDDREQGPETEQELLDEIREAADNFMARWSLPGLTPQPGQRSRCPTL